MAQDVKTLPARAIVGQFAEGATFEHLRVKHKAAGFQVQEFYTVAVSVDEEHEILKCPKLRTLKKVMRFMGRLP